MQTASLPFTTRSGARPVQDAAELWNYLALIRAHQVKRYLEIGCRHGDTLFEVLSRIGPGAVATALDLPSSAANEAVLRQCVDELRADGASVELLIGSSHDPVLVKAAQRAGPYDLVLIDGDHRYAAVKADWKNYGHLAPIVAIHDIGAPLGHLSAGHPVGVGQFWNEIKGSFRHQEFITPGSNMGFGIIYR
jgi:cephalosporin hydroxylase